MVNLGFPRLCDDKAKWPLNQEAKAKRQELRAYLAYAIQLAKYTPYKNQALPVRHLHNPLSGQRVRTTRPRARACSAEIDHRKGGLLATDQKKKG